MRKNRKRIEYATRTEIRNLKRQVKEAETTGESHLKLHVEIRGKYEGYGNKEYVVKVWVASDTGEPYITCTFADLDLAAHWRKTQMNELAQAADGKRVCWRITERISRSISDDGEPRHLTYIHDVRYTSAVDDVMGDA